MSWDLLGGDPAPGSVPGVQAVANAFGRVVDQVSAVHHTLTQVGSDGGDLDWQGEGRVAFITLADKLPPQLQNAIDSFTDARDALRRYAATLEDAQAHARQLNATASTAAGDRDVANNRLTAANRALISAQSRVNQAVTTRQRAQATETANADPSRSAALAAASSTARAAERAAITSRDAAKADVARHTAAVEDANARIDQARRQADGVRNQVRAAAQAAVAALKDAQKAGDLPGLLDRLVTDTNDWLQVNGPALAQLCRDAAGVAGVVAFLLTIAAAGPLAPAALSLVMLASGGFSVAALVLDVVDAAGSPEGFTTEAVWQIVADGLMAVGSFAGAGAVNAASTAQAANAAGAIGKAASAATHAVELKVTSQVTSDVSALASGYAKDGWEGVGVALGAMVVTAGVSAGVQKAGPTVLRTGQGMLQQKAPGVVDKLSSLSGDVRKLLLTDMPGTEGVHLPGFDDSSSARLVQVGQSILAQGGQFLPGHGDAADPTSHALPAQEVVDDLEGVTDWVVDHLIHLVEPEGAAGQGRDAR